MTAQADHLQGLDWHATPWVIVLDGCRADAFEAEYPGYLTGTYAPVHNGGYAFTANWFAHHFSQEYPVPFFHGGQPIYTFETNPPDYDERDHFATVPPWRAYEWGTDDIQTSIPSGVTNVVKEYATPATGGVVRYIQPHNPYRLLPDVRSRTDAAMHSTDDLRAAYHDNLRWVLEELRDGLLPWLDGREVYVTADHGQALGEACCGQYLHGPWYDECGCLNVVPWLRLT